MIPWFADFANYIASALVPPNLSFHMKKFIHDMKKLFWDECYLYRSCAYGVIRRYVPEVKMLSTLETFHSSPVGGNHNGIRTVHIILQ